MEDFLSDRRVGRIRERRKRMDVDEQAAVGDQLTTAEGSSFGLRRGGMVAWKYCSLMRQSVVAPHHRLTRISLRHPTLESYTPVFSRPGTGGIRSNVRFLLINMVQIYVGIRVISVQAAFKRILGE